MMGSGFIKSPLSQMKLINDDAELHCEVIGNPIPEVQWWFIEGEEPDETFTQLFDGARNDRVQINATYIAHATSTIHLTSLTLNDSGTYECRASNDPDRNELKKTPKIKWIRSQANIIVIESEWQRKYEETPVSVAGCPLLISEVLVIQLLLHSTAMLPSPVSPPTCFPKYKLSLSLPQKLRDCPVVENKPGHYAWLGFSLCPVIT
uniref:Ig-like domain-containing protein n=1 Tax=Salarias fasciatus TaxID=181472 RepID=A0A672HRD3_SALFA